VIAVDRRGGARFRAQVCATVMLRLEVGKEEGGRTRRLHWVNDALSRSRMWVGETRGFVCFALVTREFCG
jgi:hypothetical protein